MSDTESITLAQHLTDSACAPRLNGSGISSDPCKARSSDGGRDFRSGQGYDANDIPSNSLQLPRYLVQCGLIKQVNFVREPTRYCPNLHEHAHFHDETTGEIHDVEIPADLTARLRSILRPATRQGISI